MALVNHSAQLVVKDVEALLANREQRSLFRASARNVSPRKR